MRADTENSLHSYILQTDFEQRGLEILGLGGPGRGEGDVVAVFLLCGQVRSYLAAVKVHSRPCKGKHFSGG